MNYRQINEQLKDVRLKIQSAIPNYWQSRIDKMIDVTPEPMRKEPLYLYVPKNVIDLVGWEYRGIELLQVTPLQEGTMYLSQISVFLN